MKSIIFSEWINRSWNFFRPWRQSVCLGGRHEKDIIHRDLVVGRQKRIGG